MKRKQMAATAVQTGERRGLSPAVNAAELQREIAERLLLSALRERDAAQIAEVLRRDAARLASEGQRLAASLDEKATLTAMARMSLPYLGAWCIIDTLGDDGSMSRMAIIHPDPDKQTIVDGLNGRWLPVTGDRFGLPAALINPEPTVIAGDDVAVALAGSAHDPVVAAALQELGVSTMLTVPLMIRGRVIGAVTYVGGPASDPLTSEDRRLAEDLAERGAMALDRARIYGEALVLKERAEVATQAKSEFLGMMSHELRTPLNAIGGYLDLMDLEIHGPITEEQRLDIARIRFNQRYLTGLISDLLNFTKVGSARMDYDARDVMVGDVIGASIALIGTLVERRQLTLTSAECDPGIVVHGDRERIIQVLVNLLSNAIKFTPPSGRITVECEATADMVRIRVSDTGIGIPPDKLDVIFEPFVQVKDRHSSTPEQGIGLGLAISRGLARGMKGDLTVGSRIGHGTVFTLSLPRATGKPPIDSGR